MLLNIEEDKVVFYLNGVAIPRRFPAKGRQVAIPISKFPRVVIPCRYSTYPFPVTKYTSSFVLLNDRIDVYIIDLHINLAYFVMYRGALFAAASFMSFQHCRFNFGAEKFKYDIVVLRCMCMVDDLNGVLNCRF